MDPVERNTLIPLRAAVERYQAEPGSPSNVYEWYRKTAHRSGNVHIGVQSIPVTKVGNQWFVGSTDLETALQSHRDWLAHIADVSADYEAHTLHEGDQVLTWGGYRNDGDFHFVWSNYEVHCRKSDGYWYCNGCFKPAERENDQLECPVCSERGSCRGDCAFITIYCPECGARKEM